MCIRDRFKDDRIDESTKEETIIDSDLEILFPTTYIPSSVERLNLYQKLSIIENNEELELFKIQLIDRFGYLPTETVNLLESVKLKWIGKELGFRKIILKNKKPKISLSLSDERKFAVAFVTISI